MNPFYTVVELMLTDQNLTAKTEIDKTHRIFQGHFPSKPVLPGVCQIQMVSEILEGALKKPLLLNKASRIKFARLVDPNDNAELLIEVKYSVLENAVNVSASAKHMSAECFSMKATYLVIG